MSNKLTLMVRIPRALRAGRPGQAVQVDTLTVSLRPGRTVRHFTAVDRLALELQHARLQRDRGQRRPLP